MIRIGYRKEHKTIFPSFQDSLLLYKDAIINSINKEDLKTADINLQRLISILEIHSKKENRLNQELEEVKKRHAAFQSINGLGKIF
ncbi:MAG: hypothetical protein HC831_07500 [Chloroflexia bacterium]|nr:hypothetical protein [Chloroflexia bacterium]